MKTIKGVVGVLMFILSLLIGLGRGARVAVKSQGKSARARSEEPQHSWDSYRVKVPTNEQPRRPFD